MDGSSMPDWINQNKFTDVLKKEFSEFKNITSFNVISALSIGENYLTIVLRVIIDILLQDGQSRVVKYILKIPLMSDNGEEHEFHSLFVTEAEMYSKLVPEFELLYREYVGITIKFQPKHFEFTVQPECDYLLLEDLRELGYMNLNRMVGCNQMEMEAVLKKLAQWHAASAKRVEVVGAYSENYRESYFSATNREFLEQMNKAFSEPFLDSLNHYQLTNEEKETIRKYDEQLTDLYIEFGKINEDSFNVLNHGDFWCNNFMFKHSKDGNSIEDVCFVDFQLPKFGTPAQDILTLLITSPTIDIKFNKFDHFIDFYHAQLETNLNLLNFQQKTPTLLELHTDLKKNGLWAYVCAQRMLPLILLPPNKDSSIDNFMSQNKEGMAFKKLMLTNPCYIQQIEKILPWLIQRKYIC